MSKKIVIVGGVAGGATAAARLRRLDESAQIVMFERGEYISFANCGLPYYIGGAIQERDALLVQTVEGMSQKFNLDIRNLTEVVSINRENKTVTVKNLRTQESYEESYDYLILSPGAKPIRPNIEGIDEAKNLYTLRNIPDTDKIKAHVDQNEPKRAVVIGGGFIGLEMVENLCERGVQVTLVEMANQVMAPIDYEMAAIVHDHLVDKGVELLLEDGVKAFANNGSSVILNSGKTVSTDMIIMAIGVEPENKLAKEAGLELGVRNTIKVNDSLQTSDSGIYAIGDAIEVKDYVNGSATMIPLAWPANRQGRIAADHIYGHNVSYKGTLGTSIAKVFDLTVAATGNNEKTLQRLNMSYEVIHIHPNSHAGYYPGAFPVSLKLLFNPQTGEIYGAQGVGLDGVDKRIDVIATAIKGNLSVYDLPDLELAYAPPYSSAKDPVNMAGYVASNVCDNVLKQVQWHEIDSIVNEGNLLIDVRDPIEIDMGYITNSINIPLDTLRDRLDDIPKNKTIYVYCQVGLRGYLATRILQQHGYEVRNLDGGYRTYKVAKQEKDDEAVENVVPANVLVEQQIPTKLEAKVTLNACGLQCPGPIMRVNEAMSGMDNGEVLEVQATDPGFAKDIAAWCKKTSNTLVNTTFENKVFKAWIQKGQTGCPLTQPTQTIQEKDGTTLVVFSGDFDKAMASFIIASGAAAMGKKVTMFFTFWGLNVLRKHDAPEVNKDMMEKMFGMMMPKGVKKLPLSKMNMGGLGSKMIQHVMNKKNVDDLNTLMTNAQKAGVKLVACSMSMDIMGIKESELIDGVELGGVAAYLGDAEEANLNLFV
ncbi:CoA-disulfide reductase [Bacillus sp. HMF5848]|uniref:CoA-disulfide reductase n=1 Tax=Bacillus sp. HMF5848 TaxID=2495421 RepID=UPI000F78759B|nr:CoA-disulfide reductase [Bacillus sp. HMF5848]RSK26205.1 CoA-disulfide reductase [Bacillus sp. HMF5848]